MSAYAKYRPDDPEFFNQTTVTEIYARVKSKLRSQFPNRVDTYTKQDVVGFMYSYWKPYLTLPGMKKIVVDMMIHDLYQRLSYESARVEQVVYNSIPRIDYDPKSTKSAIHQHQIDRPSGGVAW